MAVAPDKKALAELNEALRTVLEAIGSSPKQSIARRVRDGLKSHAEAVEMARALTDPIKLPDVSFDPSDPKIVGQMVSIALLAQPLVPLNGIVPAYGSGVYGIYYTGPNSLYSGISGSETPIYVGKADPADQSAATPREQGAKLTGRLIEHANTIRTAEGYIDQLTVPLEPICVSDFQCRRLVCATNAQLVAEKHLIRIFAPLWNAETKACWGMSKHGDSAGTRSNKRSPWDVVHPGRLWALDDRLEDSLTPVEIRNRIDETLRRIPPRRDHAQLLEELLTAFSQQGQERKTVE